MTGVSIVTRGDARALQLPDASVDLIVTSPPYFALRSYQDGGEHYDGQIGSEPTPAEFLAALWECTREWVRVLKPSGSLWVNLGDKYAGGGGQWDKDERPDPNKRRAASGSVATGGNTYGLRAKSLMGIPWRYALGCIDDLGLILRAEVIWAKPNGLPESVTDRVRRSHEQWFHFTVQPRYYSAVDEIREAHSDGAHARRSDGTTSPKQAAGLTSGVRRGYMAETFTNPLGKLPGSVWEIATEPLTVPEHVGVDHFAAFPTEWPRRIIAGWSPREVCSACGEGRRPVPARFDVDRSRPQAQRAIALAEKHGLTDEHIAAVRSVGVSDTGRGAATQNGTGKNTAEVYRLADEARLALGGYSREFLLQRPTGLDYACACPDTSAPSTPGVVLDPFGGTGTVALVAKALGRVGISNDLSADYCRLAKWRTSDPAQIAKAMRVDKPPVQVDGQADLFGDEVA